MTTTAYHFTAGATLRDGRPVPPIGEWLEHDGPVKLCASGLHASERLLDALGYAPGLTLHVVTCEGVERGDDKLVCRRRRIELTRGVSLCAVVRLAIESACLAAWCTGLYLPDLLTALDAADREDFAAASDARDAAWAASAAASAARAARAASAAARVAWDASAAASAAARAARAARDAAWDAAGAAAWDAARDCPEDRARVLLGVTS